MGNVTSTQLLLEVGHENDCKYPPPPTHPPHRNSMSLISQLLPTRFDQTLKIGSWDHLEPIFAVKKIFAKKTKFAKKMLLKKNPSVKKKFCQKKNFVKKKFAEKKCEKKVLQ